MRSTELEETIKWGAPVYTINGKNTVGMAAFKNHYALWFYQGALLKEKYRFTLQRPGGKNKGALDPFGKGHLAEAGIDQQIHSEGHPEPERGKTIKPQPKKEIEIPDGMATDLKNDIDLKKSFERLTPGKQREHAEHISQAKRETTKLKRLEKIIPMIRNGQGLYDKYKNC